MLGSISQDDPLHTFISEGPFIIKMLEEEAQIPLDTVQKWIRGHRKLPLRHYRTLERLMYNKYGYRPKKI